MPAMWKVRASNRLSALSRTAGLLEGPSDKILGLMCVSSSGRACVLGCEPIWLLAIYPNADPLAECCLFLKLHLQLFCLLAGLLSLREGVVCPEDVPCSSRWTGSAEHNRK